MHEPRRESSRQRKRVSLERLGPWVSSPVFFMWRIEMNRILIVRAALMVSVVVCVSVALESQANACFGLFKHCGCQSSCGCSSEPSCGCAKEEPSCAAPAAAAAPAEPSCAAPAAAAPAAAEPSCAAPAEPSCGCAKEEPSCGCASSDNCCKKCCHPLLDRLRSMLCCKKSCCGCSAAPSCGCSS
jgi:hypothetical protein